MELDGGEAGHITSLIDHGDTHEDVVHDGVDGSDKLPNGGLRVSLSVHLDDSGE